MNADHDVWGADFGQVAGHAAVPQKCGHAWASKHEPGHLLYWVRQCVLCHAVDWDDLDAEIGRFASHGRIMTMAEYQATIYETALGSIRVSHGAAGPEVFIVGPQECTHHLSADEAREAAAALIRVAGEIGKERGASDEDRIRDAMAEAQDHPGRVVTR
jgi:hypothetical protein